MLELNKDLVKIQAELKVPKNQFNKFGGYKYRSCEDIVEAVKPLVKELNLSLQISDEVVLIGERYYIKATASINSATASIKSTAFAREEEVLKGMSAAQITGAASSYARKYALNGLLAIDDTRDADTVETAPMVAKQIQPAKPVASQVAKTAPMPAPASRVFGVCPECGSNLLKSRFDDGLYCSNYKAGCKYKATIGDKRSVEDVAQQLNGKVVDPNDSPINLEDIPF